MDMEDYERPDDKEGMGCIAWTMASIALGLALIMFACSGCEEDNDSEDNSVTIEASTNGASVNLVQDGAGNLGVINVQAAPDSDVGNINVMQRGTQNVGVVNYSAVPFVVPEPSDE